ncbi:hypothetical protein [Faecalibacillus intestinalis]|uniref:hypothetical protein n=1 Tax=Faecalibacillus intestinalis TaxID=1982626 RepID=UPI003992F24F
MVVKYVNSIEAIDPIATLRTLFKAGSTIITAVLGLIFTPYVLIEAKKLVGIFIVYVHFLCQRKNRTYS